MRSLQVLDVKNNPIIWPPSDILNQPLKQIMEYLKGTINFIEIIFFV